MATRLSPRRIENTPTASAGETRQFLTHHSITDDELMRELWNVSSGLPGLLDARPPGSSPRQFMRRGERDYTYNPATGRYRRVANGKLVTERELRSAVFKVSTEAKNRVRKETEAMMAGTILFVIWYARIRSVMKALLRAVWAVTWGGILFEDDSSRAAFYIWSVLFFENIDKFKIAVESGTMDWTRRIVAYAGSLARKANGMYQNAKLVVAERRGHNEARRVLGENENHCHDDEKRGLPGCVELADLGWLPIKKIVPIGDSTCNGNCLCQLETRKRPNA